MYDTMNGDQKIELDFNDLYNKSVYFVFNLEGHFILYHDNNGTKAVFIYTTQIKNNKWDCKRIYKISKDCEFISISKYDKLYFFSNNSIFECDLITQKSIKILSFDEEIKNVNKVIRLINFLNLFENILYINPFCNLSISS